MKLKDALDQWEKDKKDWPDGFNFKYKSKFIGITNSDDKIILTQDLIDGDDWGFLFESRDKEFNEMLMGDL